MQKKALRIMANTPWDAYTNILFNELKILKFTDIFKHHLAKFIFLQTNNLTFVPPIMYAKGNIDINPYSTRRSNQIHTEFAGTKTLHDSFLIKGPQYWNSIQTNLTNCITIERFHPQLKQYLLTAYH